MAKTISSKGTKAKAKSKSNGEKVGTKPGSTLKSKQSVNENGNKMSSSKGETQPEPFPSHFPVSSMNTSVPKSDDGKDKAVAKTSNNNHLKPGDILHRCTGKDIKMMKNSDSRPNLTIGKGRFLFILPGLLSLRYPKEKESKRWSKKQDANTNTNNNVNETVKGDDDIIGGLSLNSMGKIRGLTTTKPILIVPLPNGDTLRFEGRKIQSTSKFLVMNCRSSGIVSCKHVFQEIVVFGDYHISKAKAKCAVDKDEDKQGKKNLQCDQQLASISDQNFNHYGGSERAIDGGLLRKGGKRSSLQLNNQISSPYNVGKNVVVPKSLDSAKSEKAEVINIDCEEVVDDEGSDDDSDDMIKVLSDDATSDVEYDMSKLSTLPTRSRSSRNSASKNVQYNFDSTSEEDSVSSEVSNVSGEDLKSDCAENIIQSNITSKQNPKNVSVIDLIDKSDTESLTSNDLNTSNQRKRIKLTKSPFLSDVLGDTKIVPCSPKNLETPKKEEVMPSDRKALGSVVSLGRRRRRRTGSSGRNGTSTPKQKNTSMNDTEFIFLE
jgi:hypothetical protein